MVYVYHANSSKKKRGRQHIYAQLAKKLKKKCRQFCPNIFGHFSLLLSPQFGKKMFWWGRREKLRAPPKSLPFSTLNQITTNTIFSPLFFPSFSILPIITPTKWSLNIYCQEIQDVKYKPVSNFYQQRPKSISLKNIWAWTVTYHWHWASTTTRRKTKKQGQITF